MLSLILGRQWLEINIGKEGFRWDIPDHVLSNSVLKSSELFKKSFIEFLKANSIKPGDITIYLSEEILFCKEFNKKPGLRKEIDFFYEVIPFDGNKLTHVEIDNKDKILAIVCYTEVFEFIAEILIELGYFVAGAFPKTDLVGPQNLKKANMLSKKSGLSYVTVIIVSVLLAIIFNIIFFIIGIDKVLNFVIR